MTSDVSECDLGAVLIAARRQQREIMHLNPKIHKALRSKCWEASTRAPNETTADRVCSINDLIYSSYSGAVFSACSYFRYAELWEMKGRTAGSESFDALTAITHTLADVVPIELFNFSKILKSIEFFTVFSPTHSHIIDIFDSVFPNLDHARHAVAHGHDRDLGKAVVRGKIELFERNINTAMLAKHGKRYVGANGDEFIFEFDIARLSSFWARMVCFLEDQCA